MFKDGRRCTAAVKVRVLTVELSLLSMESYTEHGCHSWRVGDTTEWVKKIKDANMSKTCILHTPFDELGFGNTHILRCNIRDVSVHRLVNDQACCWIRTTPLIKGKVMVFLGGRSSNVGVQPSQNC